MNTGHHNLYISLSETNITKALDVAKEFTVDYEVSQFFFYSGVQYNRIETIVSFKRLAKHLVPSGQHLPRGL